MTTPTKQRPRLDAGPLATLETSLFDFKRGRAVSADPTSTKPVSIYKDEDPTRKQHLDAKKSARPSAGPMWFDMTAPEMTPEIQRDLRLLRLRRWANPKQHFKSDDFVGKNGELPTVFQLATVIEGTGERSLSRKERRPRLALEMLADRETRVYAKKVFNAVQRKRESGGLRGLKQRERKKKNSGR